MWRRTPRIVEPDIPEEDEDIKSQNTLDRDRDLHESRSLDLESVDFDMFGTLRSRASLGHGTVVVKVGTKPSQNQSTNSRCIADGGRFMSIAYAIILMLLGVIFPIKEAAQRNWMSEYTMAVYLLYLFIISIAFIIFLEIYLMRKGKWHYTYDLDGQREDKKEADVFVRNQYNRGQGNFAFEHGEADPEYSSTHSDPMELYIVETVQPMPHHTGLFLRIAVAVLGLGIMVYDGLQLKLLHELHPNECCYQDIFWIHYIHLLFVIVQTFFVLKHPQIPISMLQPLSRLGFMHIFAANFCVWFRSVVREIAIDIWQFHDNEIARLSNSSIPDCAYNKEDEIFNKASPFLYPCFLQYSLLVAAAMYCMYCDVGIVTNKKNDPEISESEIPTNTNSNDDKNQQKEKVNFIEINFGKSHRGLYGGIVLFAAACVSVIIFYSYTVSDGGDDTRLIIYYASSMVLCSSSVCAVIIGSVQARKLRFIPTSYTGIHACLMMIGLIGSVLYYLCLIVANAESMIDGSTDIGTILSFCSALVICIALLCQGSFVLNLMSRKTFTDAELKAKPGRGCVTFLLILNLTCWLFHLLHPGIKDYEKTNGIHVFSFYLWTPIPCIFQPFVLFYFFQTSTCLGCIWTQVYKKSENQLDIPSPPPPQPEAESKQNEIVTDFYTDIEMLSPEKAAERNLAEMIRKTFKKTGNIGSAVDALQSPVSVV